MSEHLARMAAALKDRRWDDYDEAWLDAIENNEGGIDDFLNSARNAIGVGAGARAGELLALLGPQAKTLEPRRCREFFETLCLCVPKNRDFRDELSAAYENEFSHVDGYEAYARLADIKRTNDLPSAIHSLRSMLMFVPGAFVFHRSGWGVGEITEVATIEGIATIDFQEKPGHRVRLDAIPDVCDLLPNDHFKVRAWREREQLQEMAKEKPLELIKLVLATSDRPMSLSQIRETISGTAMPSGDWSKWWSKHRNALKKDPNIGIGGGRSATYFLQEEAQGLAGELERRLAGLGLKESLPIVREAVHDATDEERPELKPFLAKMKREMLRGDGDIGLRLEVLLFLRRHGDDEIQEHLPHPLEFADATRLHPADLINSLARAEDQEEVLRHFIDERTELWSELAVELLLRTATSARDLVISKLVEAGRGAEIDHWAREVQRVPKKAPMFFLWLVRCAGRKKYDNIPVIEKIPAIDLFMRAVSLLDDLTLRLEHEETEELKLLVKRYRSVLGSRPFTLLESTFEGSAVAAVRNLYAQIEASRGFSGTTRQRMLATVLRSYPTLLASTIKCESKISDDVIYSTDAGIRRLQLEIEEIRNEKLPAIFKAIGDAAAMGDLSENYEFTSAIEERENLNRRVMELQSQYDKAVRIDLEAADTSQASIGTRVTLLNLQSQAQETYSILGPWDADPTHGVVSYKAPLGQALLNNKVGDEIDVTLPDGNIRYRIEQIVRHEDQPSAT